MQSKHGGKRDGAGRKRKPESELMRVGSIRLKDWQWEKLEWLGGAEWIRVKIARAKTGPKVRE